MQRQETTIKAGRVAGRSNPTVSLLSQNSAQLLGDIDKAGHAYDAAAIGGPSQLRHSMAGTILAWLQAGRRSTLETLTAVKLPTRDNSGMRAS
jgi:hypothetical protein